MPFLGTTPTQGFVGANPKQSFTANWSTTVFTLTHPVASANDLEVFVGNVRQEPTAAYTAAGTTLTMSEAPDTGLNFYVINKSQAQVTTTPPVNSISTDKILSSAVTTAKIADSAITDAKIGGMASSKLTGALPALDGASLTNAGGMQLILDQTFGGLAGAGSITSFDISDTYINSTYDAYLLEAYFRPSADNKYLQFRVKVGGTIQTGSIYGYGGKALDGDAEFGDNADSVFGMHMYGCGTQEGEGSSLVMTMQNINSTTEPFAWHCQNTVQNTDDNHTGNAACGSLKAANRGLVVNGLSFFWHSGNIHGGRAKLYGLRT